jgi:hypothetical protein
MKRFMALAAALASLAAFSTPSQADVPVLTGWKLIPLQWRHQVANSSATVDSTSFSEGSTGYKADTTAAFSVEGFKVPEKLGVAAADSITQYFLIINKANTSTITGAADTVYAQQQVSLDGSNWMNVTPTILFVATTAQPTNMPDIGAILVERGTSDSWMHRSKVVFAAAGQEPNTVAENVTTAPTAVQLYGYPFHRWCIYGDYTGKFVGYVMVRDVRPQQ